MHQDVFHGILVDQAFTDRSYPTTFSIFALKQIGGWGLIGVIIHRDNVEMVVADIQSHMRQDQPFYNHLYDDELVIVIFKKCRFQMTPHASSWITAQKYGTGIGIPLVQLDFWPNRFQDEIHYFGKENFI